MFLGWESGVVDLEGGIAHPGVQCKAVVEQRRINKKIWIKNLGCAVGKAHREIGAAVRGT